MTTPPNVPVRTDPLARARSVSSVLALAVVAAALTAPAVADAEDFLAPEPVALDADLRQRLEQGEIVANADQKELLITRLVGLVEAPPSDVWRVIDDYDSQKEWVPGLLENSSVLERNQRQMTCRTGLALPWPLADRTYRVHVENGEMEVGDRPAYVSRWSHVEGSGNVEAVEGYWLIQPWGGSEERTLVKQVTRLDLGVAVPSFLLERGSRRRLPGVMEALRERVRSTTSNE